MISPNPYEPPKVHHDVNPTTVDYCALALRIVVALQLLSIAFLAGLWQHIIPQAYGDFAFALVPIAGLGLPVLAVALAGNMSRIQFAAVCAIETALFGLQIMALLPAVQ